MKKPTLPGGAYGIRSVNEKKQPGLKDRAVANILETLKPTSASRLA
ncbi:MAG: hypothetical protein AAB251_05080 [Deltaproteobacteria bacterium]